jgi:hypothetical protein
MATTATIWQKRQRFFQTATFFSNGNESVAREEIPSVKL